MAWHTQGSAAGGATQKITDNTETNLINLRRTIYLTIMSALDFEEAGHKLMKIQLAPGQETEVATMIIECCSQEKSYSKCALSAAVTWRAQTLQPFCPVTWWLHRLANVQGVLGCSSSICFCHIMSCHSRVACTTVYVRGFKVIVT